MLRAIPALLMVLLIGNPVCCCAVAAPRAETAPSCCQELAAEDGSAPAEAPRHTCPCARKAGVVVADKLLVPPPVLLMPLPALLPDGPGSLALVPSAASSLSSRIEPPPRAAPPVPLHLLYGVFRC